MNRSAAFACFAVASFGAVAPAQAYPSSLIFAPTGESMNFASIQASNYTAIITHSAAPHITLEPWAGVQAGLAPGFDYDASGVSFGGVEAGVDIFSSAFRTESFTKLVLNAKAQILRASNDIPSLAVGLMGFAPGSPHRSLNLGYATLTEPLDFGMLELGRIHVGYAHAFTSDDALFSGSFPFRRGSREALLAGYESPTFGPFYFAIEHFGGVSEVSSSNVALGYQPTDHVAIMGGYSRSNDRSVPYDGPFLGLSVDWSYLSPESPATPPAKPFPSGGPSKFFAKGAPARWPGQSG